MLDKGVKLKQVFIAHESFFPSLARGWVFLHIISSEQPLINTLCFWSTRCRFACLCPHVLHSHLSHLDFLLPFAVIFCQVGNLFFFYQQSALSSVLWEQWLTIVLIAKLFKSKAAVKSSHTALTFLHHWALCPMFATANIEYFNCYLTHIAPLWHEASCILLTRLSLHGLRQNHFQWPFFHCN